MTIPDDKVCQQSLCLLARLFVWTLSLSNGLLGNWVIGNFKEKGKKNKKTRWQHERTSIKADWRNVLFCSDGEHTSKIQHCHSVHFWALFSHCRRCDGNYQAEQRCNFSSKGCTMFLILFKQSITTHTLPFCSDIDASLLFIFFFLIYIYSHVFLTHSKFEKWDKIMMRSP